MADSGDLKICNIKITIITNKPLSKLRLRFNNLRLNCYRESNHLHATGLKTYQDLKLLEYFINKKLNVCIKLVRIDNIFLNKSRNLILNMRKLCEISIIVFREQFKVALDYTPELFPGVFLFLKEKKSGAKCTIIFFHTGSVQGHTNSLQLLTLLNICIKNILQHFK